jgi:hypothetical protein
MSIGNGRNLLLKISPCNCRINRLFCFAIAGFEEFPVVLTAGDVAYGKEEKAKAKD